MCAILRYGLLKRLEGAYYMKSVDLKESVFAKSMNLNDEWFIAKDSENVGKSEEWEKSVREDAVPAYVPSIIQQFFPEYHGTAYYWCKFSANVELGKNERALLQFGGADYFAEVWLNSVYLGSYEGGETPFSFDATECIKQGEENLLCVRIINPCDKYIDGFNLSNTPHRNKVIRKSAGANLNHGGLWYGVSLAIVPKVYVKDKFLAGNIKTGEINFTVTASSSVNSVAVATLTVAVYENNDFGNKITEKAFALDTTNKREFKGAISVPGFKLWSTDEPNLYRVEINLTTEYGTHTSFVKFGFREFTVKGGFFYLNGKKTFVKSAHSGNAFPIGEMLPVRPEHTTKDFIYAKASGFNMLRAIAGMFRPEQLDVADEIGLMIYEECFASWCMGHSQLEDWQNEEEFQANVNGKHADLPVDDEEKMLERWRASTEKMILRDRNHPSIVIWGLLNETRNNSVFRCAKDYLPRARELDPTRLIILNSGRFDFDFSVGSAANPYVTEWENTWGMDGHPEMLNEVHKYKCSGDCHFYAPTPISKPDAKFFKIMGSNVPRPMFLSEFGIGSQFNVIEEYKHFVQYGERIDLEDSSWLKYQSDRLTEDFYKFGLEKLFASPEALLKETQRVNADERKRIFDLLRSNPYLAGYSLTGLLDHGMCGEGLWSYWRRWKPGMYDTVSDGFEPLRFCLFATPAVYSGEEFEIEAHLANEGVLKSGTYNARFAITGEDGVADSFSVSFELNGDDFATPIMKRTVKLNVPAGRYELTASLDEGSPAGYSTEFFVFERKAKIVSEKKIYQLGFNEVEKALLDSMVEGVLTYNGESDGVILVARTDANGVARVFESAENGAKVFFIDRGMLFDEKNFNAVKALDGTLRMDFYYDWLYHKDYALLNREIFDGFGDKIAPLTKFGDAFARNQAFLTDRTPDFTPCPGFVTGYYNVNMSYASMHAILGYKRGEGEVYLTVFRLLENIGHPVAERLIYNIVKYMLGRI